METIKKNKILSNYKYELSKMFSCPDFIPFLGLDVENKIMKVSEISKYNDILELLPKKSDYKIILTETEPNSGHWCCLFNNGTQIIWADSYGVEPDGELAFISNAMNKLLKQRPNELQRIMKTAFKHGLEPIYSKHKFQASSDNVCTCGRWTTFFIMMINMGYSLPDMKELVERYSKELKKPNDIIICDWIP